jgi:hypothetical protein
METPDANDVTAEPTTRHGGINIALLESASFWSNIAVVTFGVVAAASAVLALYFSSRLGALKDADLARYQAESRAAIAASNTRAAEANAHAAEANKLAEGLRRDVAVANERAAAATEAAERERLARIRLEVRLAPRTLNDAQQKAIAVALSGSARVSVQILMYADTSEVAKIGSDIGAALRQAGWPVGVAGARGRISMRGIVVGVTSGATPDAEAAASNLVGALRNNGLGAVIATEPYDAKKIATTLTGGVMHQPQVLILVGDK